MTSGIYKYTCKANGKIYIGLSIDIETRQYKRLNRLRKYAHNPQRGLLNDFHKYGEENFSLEVIEVCDDVSKLRNLEIEYINLFKSYNPTFGYNRLSDRYIKDENERGLHWGSSYGLKL